MPKIEHILWKHTVVNRLYAGVLTKQSTPLALTSLTVPLQDWQLRLHPLLLMQQAHRPCHLAACRWLGGGFESCQDRPLVLSGLLTRGMPQTQARSGSPGGRACWNSKHVRFPLLTFTAIKLLGMSTADLTALRRYRHTFCDGPLGTFLISNGPTLHLCSRQAL